MSASVDARVEKLVALGASETVARSSVLDADRQKRLGQDLVVGGALTLASEMPDTAYAVPPVLARGQLVACTAHPGHGKSTLFAGICFAGAAGRKLGQLDPVDGSLWYFVSAEDVQGTRNRLLAEVVRHKLTADECAAIDERLRWVHINAPLRPEIILDAIAQDAEGRPIALIVIDTGPAVFLGDDENANAQQQDHAAAWRRGTELGGQPCVVILCHPRKGAGADDLDPRGGSAFVGSLDANLTLWKDDDVVTLGFKKLRSEVFEPMKFRLDPVPLVLASGARLNIPVAVPISDAGAEAIESEASQRRAAIIGALHGAPPLGIREIARRVFGDERRKSTVSRDLDELTKGPRALIERDQVAGKLVLTAAGKKAGEAIRARETQAYREAADGR